MRAPLGPAVELPAGQSPDGAGPGTSGQAALLAVVAHELRAPLQSLCAGSEQLVDHLDELDPAQIADRVRILRRGSLQLWTLVENLLRTARSGAGAMTIAPCAREPLALVNDVESLVAPLMQQKSQALRVSAPPELPSVSADAPHIQQVLVNLLVNASKFSPAGSTIDLRLHHRPSVVRTVVADRGPGLPPGNVQRLFEPYARGARDRFERVEGLGLGLYVVQTIIEAHRGRLGAHNRRGGGAEFWFDLPLAAN